MTVSVILPTYNRLDSVLTAVGSLQGQACPRGEIVVVDNAADATLEQRLMEIQRRAVIPCRYVREARLGLHYARHAGARAASGDLLLFSDDDATFAPAWVQAYTDAFRAHPAMAAAGGPVLPVWATPPPQWLLDFIGDARTFGILSLMNPYDTFRLDRRGWFFGVNMAIRRSVLFDVGGFNPDSFGDTWLGDGETGLNRKLWEHGLLIGYVPEAIVYHHIPPQRLTVEYFCQRAANEAACQMYARFHAGMPNARRLSKHAGALTLRNLHWWMLAGFLRGRVDPRSLRVQLHAAETQAKVRYVIRLLRSKTFREMVVQRDWL